MGELKATLVKTFDSYDKWVLRVTGEQNELETLINVFSRATGRMPGIKKMQTSEGEITYVDFRIYDMSIELYPSVFEEIIGRNVPIRSRNPIYLERYLNMIPLTQEELNKIAKYVMAIFYPQMSVSLPFSLGEIFQIPEAKDISILRDNIVITSEGVYKLNFVKVSDAKFEEIEKKYKKLLEENIRREYETKFLTAQEYLRNLIERFNDIQKEAVKQVTNILSVAQNNGYKLRPDFLLEYDREFVPRYFIINNTKYKLDPEDFELMKTAGFNVRVKNLYVDVIGLLRHTPDGGNIPVYASKDSVHINIGRELNTLGFKPVCTGDLSKTDSITFIKQLVPLLDTMNLDSTFDRPLYNFIVDKILPRKQDSEEYVETFTVRS